MSVLAPASAVAGLVNFGNTCYVNALLQALASCSSYYEYVELLYKTFPIPQTRETDGSPMSWRYMMPLSRAIFCCLERLQPSYCSQPLVASALEVLHGIGQHDRKLFSGFTEQQDVGEVLDCLASSCRIEVHAWGRKFLINRPAILSRERFSAAEDVTSPPILLNSSRGPRRVFPSEMHAFSIDQFQALGGFDGLLTHNLQCCECGHVFDVQLDPFTSLILSIPKLRMEGRDLVVDEDVRLDTCLREFFSTRRQGPIRCPKCSFLCTVSNERSDVMPVKKEHVIRSSESSSLDPCSLEEDINNCRGTRKSSGLSDLLVETKGPTAPIGGVVYRSQASFDLKEFQNNSLKPSTPCPGTKASVMKDVLSAARTSPFHDAHVKDFKEKLEKVGIPWIHAESQVYAKTAIAKSPKVLVISLQRKVFDGTGYRKIQGRVQYPLLLDIAKFMNFRSVNSTLYRLKAVLVHQGNEDGGHFLTVRSIASQDGQSTQWVLASDEKVYMVSDSAVMGLEASMLFYEREPNPVQHPPTETSSFINLGGLES